MDFGGRAAIERKSLNHLLSIVWKAVKPCRTSGFWNDDCTSLRQQGVPYRCDNGEIVKELSFRTCAVLAVCGMALLVGAPAHADSFVFNVQNGGQGLGGPSLSRRPAET